MLDVPRWFGTFTTAFSPPLGSRRVSPRCTRAFGAKLTRSSYVSWQRLRKNICRSQWLIEVTPSSAQQYHRIVDSRCLYKLWNPRLLLSWAHSFGYNVHEAYERLRQSFSPFNGVIITAVFSKGREKFGIESHWNSKYIESMTSPI